MQDVLVCAAFFGIILLPCILATRSDHKEAQDQA
jgi:hypothetical protein